MSKLKALTIVSVLSLSIYAPTIHAESYSSQVAAKFTTGFANIFTGLIEVPKNIVYASAKTNPVVGATGGLVYGTLHTLGRTASGVFDVLSSPFPTQPMVEPALVWDDFKTPTSYGGTFK